MKNAFYALAVVALTGSMAVVALADDHGMNAYKPEGSSVSTELAPEAVQPDAGEIREPMGTGAIPELSGSSSEMFKSESGEEATLEFGGLKYRPDIDLGP